MKISKARKQPVTVRAVLLQDENEKDVARWINAHGGNAIIRRLGGLLIVTPEGGMYASPGQHYVIQGVRGEFYPCEVEVFDQTYEIVDEIDWVGT